MKETTIDEKIELVRAIAITVILFWVYLNLITAEQVIFYEIMSQSIFVTLIIIWICGIPRLYELMDVNEDFFDSEDFKKKVKSYNKRKHLKFKKNENASPTLNRYKLVYLLFWCMLIVAVCFFLKTLISTFSILLIAIYATLTAFSSYRCIAFIYFLHDLQSVEVKYNKYIPTWSYGYQRLNSAVEFLSPIYFMLAFLFTCGYLMCVIPSISPGILSTKSAVWIFLIEIVAGWGSCIIVSCLSKYYLYNIATAWRHESLKVFQARLFTACDDIDEAKIQQNLEHIKNLSVQTTGKFPLAEFSLGVLTISVNAVGIMIANF